VNRNDDEEEEEVKERRWRKMNRMKESEERATTQFSRRLKTKKNSRWEGMFTTCVIKLL
jgi:hypothetical protein